MRKLGFLFLLFLSNLLLAQDSISVSDSKKLYQSIFSFSGTTFIPAGSAKQKIVAGTPELNSFNLDKGLKQNGLVYLPENGTGRIMVLDSSGGITRLDHTKYGGDRFGAYVFFHHDTLFSIGGYGFWHTTSAIRYFDNKTKDWAPLLLKKGIHVASGINAHFFYDEHVQKVFVIHSGFVDEYLPHEIKDKKSLSLQLDIFNLKTRQWEENNFTVSTKIGREFTDLKIIAETDQYLIVNSVLHNQTLAIDFRNNNILEIDASFLSAFKQTQDQHPVCLYTYADSTLLLIDLNTNEQFAQNIKPLLTKTLFNLYEEEKTFINLLSPLSASVFLNICLAVVLFMVWARKPKKATENEAENPEEKLTNYKNKGFVDLLNEMEWQILQAIVEDFKASRLTSIDKINKILGIEKRPYKIKNNLRADALKIINKKFMDYLGNDDELIIRERSEFDKRFFEYTINERYVNKINFKKETGVS